MPVNLSIRRFQAADAKDLRQVFYSAIHLVAGQNYSLAQLNAWAPKECDELAWAQLLNKNQPFVVELNGEVVAYADLQPQGYLDHFYVVGTYARQGIGSQLMAHLLNEAKHLGLKKVFANVSLTAQPFFTKFGFVLVQQNYPKRNEVIIPNAQMNLYL